MNRLKFMLAVIFTASIFIYGESVFVKATPLPTNDKRLTVTAMGRTYEFSYPEIDFYDGKYYIKNLEERVDGIYSDTVKRAVDAEVCFYPERENQIEVSVEKAGLGIDKEGLILLMQNALNSGENKIDAPLKEIPPKRTKAEVEKSTFLKGRFTTYFDENISERKNNIVLASNLIGGREIKSGGQFSFNEVVGERSENRGFSSAKVIENGKFVEGVGGGVCQVSSTIYNAVLLSGLKVLERHAHSLKVSYVSPSFDAMVNSGSSDLRFENDTLNSVYIVVYSVKNRITVSIYGEENKFEYKRVSEVKEYIDPPENERIITNSLKRGEIKEMVIKKQGVKSAGYIEVYDGNSLIERKLVSEDNYSPLQGITLIGSGD